MSSKIKKSTQTLPIPKIIIYIAKTLEIIAPALAIKFAAKLFVTPIKHKAPKREWNMIDNSSNQMMVVPTIKKSIHLYFYGTGNQKVLLVHGWSGRGTQLVKIADALKEKGYAIVSFDAPAHGKSTGKISIMTEFIATILEIDKQFGPFDIAIGHSLGGMSILNAVKQGFQTKKIVTISAGDIIQDILDDFCAKLKMKANFSTRLRNYFESKFNEKMDDYSAYKSAKVCEIPTLLIHDEQDDDVSVKAAFHIQKHLKNGEVYITQHLGHRKILGDKSVIHKILEFIN